MTDCPDVDDLLRYADGAAGARAAELEAHLDACGACRVGLSALARDRAAHDERLGRYRVDAVLGDGGMGVVLRGYDPKLARAVALKLLRRGSERAARERLQREAQVLARLSHPNVCQVYDVDDDGDETFVAMELIDGETLRAYAARASAADLASALVAAGRGLAAAHAAGIVHRDVKPDNVLVARDGRIVVSDFGLATVPEAPAEEPGAALGTLSYAAPEQLLGHAVDARADQFAWCATAWELLCGAPPFAAATIGEQLVAISRGPRGTPPRRHARALRRGLAFEPAGRFASMAALLAAFDGGTRARTRWLVAALTLAAAFLAWRAWPARREPPAAHALSDSRTSPAAAPPAPAPPSPPAAAAASPAPPPPPASASPHRRAGAEPPPARPPARPLDDEVAMWCHLSVDPAKPSPDGAPGLRADWGRVVTVEHATLAIDQQPARAVELAEIRGAAGTHRVIAWQRTLAVGDLALVCEASRAPDAWLAQLPAAWQSGLALTALLAPIAAPPRITEKAGFAPVHVQLAELSAAARNQRWHLPTSRPVLARLPIGRALADHRYAIAGDAPFTVISDAPLAPNTRVWAIAGEPRFEAGQLVLTVHDADASYVSAAAAR